MVDSHCYLAAVTVAVKVGMVLVVGVVALVAALSGHVVLLLVAVDGGGGDCGCMLTACWHSRHGGWRVAGVGWGWGWRWLHRWWRRPCGGCGGGLVVVKMVVVPSSVPVAAAKQRQRANPKCESKYRTMCFSQH